MNSSTCCLRARSESVTASFPVFEFGSTGGGARAAGSSDGRATIRMRAPIHNFKAVLGTLVAVPLRQGHCLRTWRPALRPASAPASNPHSASGTCTVEPATHPAGCPQIAADVLIVGGLFPQASRVHNVAIRRRSCAKRGHGYMPTLAIFYKLGS
jgi:hypothetical protein